VGIIGSWIVKFKLDLHLSVPSFYAKGDKILIMVIRKEFGECPGVRILYADVSEHSVCSIFIGL